MKNNKSKKIALGGLLVAFGLLIPFVTAHAFGIPGTVLLPMHIPVLLMGFLCGPVFGAMGGILIPVLSSLLTGMPPAFPILPIMAGELFTYGLLSGLFYDKIKLSVYPSLILSMAGGRVIYGLIFSALLTANGGTLKALSVIGAFTQGIPGIVLQLILIPAIVVLVKKQMSGLIETDSKDNAAYKKAVSMIKNEEASCVFVRNGEIIHQMSGSGIAPLIEVFENQPELLKGTMVVDKIIGKAAAMLLVLGGAKSAYGEVMSGAAKTYLTDQGIQTSYGRCVDMIINRMGTGICPMERSVMHTDDAMEGYHCLKETLAKLKKNSGKPAEKITETNEPDREKDIKIS